MADPTSKTVRSFQCRDLLWERFEHLAAQLECSVDYLINDSMKNYLRQRQQASATGAASVTAGSQAAPPPLPQQMAPQQAAPPPPPPPPPVPAAARVSALPVPPPPPPVPQRRSALPPEPQRASAPPMPPPPVQAAPPSRSLFIAYGGQYFPVNKERFVIGRGRQSSDLTIKDPNVSRQHALIEQVGSQFYLVDLGSTNGVLCEGQRVARRLIQHGDRVQVCDHQIQFHFQ